MAAKANDNKIIGSVSKADEIVINLLSQNLTYVLNIGDTGKSNFLIPNAKKALNYLRQAFIKASIFQHFDPESHIRIEIDASGYVIGGVLS